MNQLLGRSMWRRAVLAALVLAPWPAIAGGESAGDAPAGRTARIDLADGTVVEGAVRALDGEELVVESGGEDRRLRVADVRQVTLRDQAAPVAPLPVRVDAADGTWIDGDDFLWRGETATIVRGARQIDVPIQHVRRVAWRDPATAAPAWVAALPDDPEEDLVVVASGAGAELVDCAISAVTADAVTVVLDGETLPVRRAKVLGLVWSRPAAVEAGVRIALEGGRLAGRSVVLEGETLVVDSGCRVPFGLVAAIDYAAARSVRLCDLEPERRSVEPYVGDLAGLAGVAEFFAPRVIPAATGADRVAAGAMSLLVRPRTVLAWRVPDGARRFRAGVAGSPSSRPGAAVRAAVRLDDRGGWEGVLDAAHPTAELELDVGGVRRLELVVDFVGLDPGGAVRLERAVFER